MKASQKAVDLIKEFEGFRAEPYLCPAGKLTIGYGTTGMAVKPGMKVTPAEAERLLRNNLREAEFHITTLVKVPLTQNQFDALVSFAYNVGTGSFGTSTLLKELNAGNYDAIPAQLKRWNKAKGKELAGLTRRRAAEAALWSAA